MTTEIKTKFVDVVVGVHVLPEAVHGTHLLGDVAIVLIDALLYLVLVFSSLGGIEKSHSTESDP